MAGVAIDLIALAAGPVVKLNLHWTRLSRRIVRETFSRTGRFAKTKRLRSKCRMPWEPTRRPEGSIQSEPSRGQRPAFHLRQAPSYDRCLDGAAGLLVSPLAIDIEADKRQLVSAAMILA